MPCDWKRKTYTKLAQNPVVTGDMMPEHFSREHFRDPKIWKEEDGYYMVVGNKTDDGKPHVVLFHSEDAISWEYVSVLAKDDTGMLGTMWECPDFFCLDGAYVLITSPQNLSADEEFHNGNNSVYYMGSYDKTSICSIMTQFTRLMTDWILRTADDACGRWKKNYDCMDAVMGFEYPSRRSEMVRHDDITEGTQGKRWKDSAKPGA